MVSERKAQSILFASVYFRELFKKTLFAATPDSITTKTQINIVVTLFAHKPMNIGALSEMTGIAREQVTRAVKALRGKGLVECEKRPENRREVIVRLSSCGESVIRGQLDEAREYLDVYLDGLEREDVDELADISERAIRLFEKTGVRPIVPSSSDSKRTE